MSCPRWVIAGCVVSLLTMPAYGIEGHFRVSEFGAGVQIWFEADFFDERVPDSDTYYPVVANGDAFFGEAVNRTGNGGGYLRYEFDIGAAGGAGGTWYFWGRVINPGNTSDYLLVEGDPGDDFIPIDEDPIPGGDGTPPFDNGDDRIFEETLGGAGFGWQRSGHQEGHTKELQDGENTMFIFHRQGDSSVFWDVFLWTDDPDYVPTDGDYLAATVMGDTSECPEVGDTHCHSITIVNPDGEKVDEAQRNRTGTYTVTVEDSDESGDDGLYFLSADNGVDPPTRIFGVTNEIEVRLTEGTWTISVTADDDFLCEDETEDATCTSDPIEIVFVPDPCVNPPEDDGAELVWAFAFGSRSLFCPTFNDPDVEYEMVLQLDGDNPDLDYDEDRGWGYVVVNDFAFDVSRFGPFDASPNNRGKFSTECPEHLYNSFIGGKDFSFQCDEFIVGDPTEPCEDGGVDPDGMIFRVDVPEGRYRFVGAFGDADNVHAHRILAENGGEGGPTEPREDFVVLVNNYDQAQQTIGEAEPAEPGEGVYARVGFDGRIPPPGDGVPPSPQFINMDEFGEATEGCPNSPTLEVTEGYIRIHQLQGNSNDGPGGPRDPNGGDAVVLEIWKLPDDTGASRKPGDVNGDGAFNISDPVAQLAFQFGSGPLPACYTAAGGAALTEAGLMILDFNGDGSSNISDAVGGLSSLFGGGPPHVLGEGCVEVPGDCESNCTP